MKLKSKRFILDGVAMPPLEYLRAAREKFKWEGLIPRPLIGYKAPNGDKGTMRNPACTTPGDICRAAYDAWLAMSKEECEAWKKEVGSS